MLYDVQIGQGIRVVIHKRHPYIINKDTRWFLIVLIIINGQGRYCEQDQKSEKDFEHHQKIALFLFPNELKYMFEHDFNS